MELPTAVDATLSGAVHSSGYSLCHLVLGVVPIKLMERLGNTVLAFTVAIDLGSRIDFFFVFPVSLLACRYYRACLATRLHICPHLVYQSCRFT